MLRSASSASRAKRPAPPLAAGHSATGTAKRSAGPDAAGCSAGPHAAGCSAADAAERPDLGTAKCSDSRTGLPRLALMPLANGSPGTQRRVQVVEKPPMVEVQPRSNVLRFLHRRPTIPLPGAPANGTVRLYVLRDGLALPDAIPHGLGFGPNPMEMYIPSQLWAFTSEVLFEFKLEGGGGMWTAFRAGCAAGSSDPWSNYVIGLSRRELDADAGPMAEIRAAARHASTDQQGQLRAKVLGCLVRLLDDLRACCPPSGKDRLTQALFRYTGQHALPWAELTADAPYAPHLQHPFDRNVASLHNDKGLWTDRNICQLGFGNCEKIMRFKPKVHVQGSPNQVDRVLSDSLQTLVLRTTGLDGCGYSGRTSFIMTNGESRPSSSGTTPYSMMVQDKAGTSGSDGSAATATTRQVGMTLCHQALPVVIDAEAASAAEIQLTFDGVCDFAKLEERASALWAWTEDWAPKVPGPLQPPSGQPRLTKEQQQELEPARPEAGSITAGVGATGGQGGSSTEARSSTQGSGDEGSSDEGGSDEGGSADSGEDHAPPINCTGARGKGWAKPQAAAGGRNCWYAKEAFLKEYGLCCPNMLVGAAAALTQHASTALGEQLCETGGEQCISFWGREFQAIRQREGQQAIDEWRDNVYLKHPRIIVLHGILTTALTLSLIRTPSTTPPCISPHLSAPLCTSPQPPHNRLTRVSPLGFLSWPTPEVAQHLAASTTDPLSILCRC